MIDPMLIEARVSRRFAASAERVFDAWTDPAMAGSWLFTTPASETHDTRLDARVGGAWTITDRRGGVDYTALGEYLEIDRPRRLVFSFAMPQFSDFIGKVVVEIAPDGAGCVLSLTQHGVQPANRAPTEKGWSDMFDQLAGRLRDWDSKGEFGLAAMVRFERFLPGPIERVWEHIADPAKLPAWFGEGPCAIAPRVGGAVSLMGGHIRGVVTQWLPPRRLAYTWNVFAPGEDVSSYPESHLSIELETQGDEVRLTLTHLPVLERFEPQNAMGWHTFLDILAAELRGEAARPRAEVMRNNAALYGVDLANLAR